MAKDKITLRIFNPDGTSQQVVVKKKETVTIFEPFSVVHDRLNISGEVSIILEWEE